VIRKPADSCRFRGDKPANNGDNRTVFGSFEGSGRFDVLTSGKALWIAMFAGCIMLAPARAHAQWWSPRAPADFEECADRAEKVTVPAERTSKLSECNAKYAGRRKPGGGYAYFDFMQNRNFDIAGPNPTPEEQKHIDEQYTVYLDQQRQSTIAAAFAARQQQVQRANFSKETEKTTPLPVAKPQTAVRDSRPRMSANGCGRHSFSCNWPRLSEGIHDLKKMLFGSPSGKAKRG
jgi:hypothetical protein